MSALEQKTLFVVGALAVVTVGAIWLSKKAVAGVASVGEAINPVSDQNIAYKAVNAVTGAITGDSSTPVGVKLWEWFNPGAVAAENAVTASDPIAGIVLANNTGGVTGTW